MADTLKRSAAAANAEADAQGAAINGGVLRIYSGSQPASPDAAATGTMLAEVSLPSPAFGAAVAGLITANAITGATAVAAGTAGWFRILSPGGAAMWDGSVGTSGCNLNINTTTLVIGQAISVSSMTYQAYL